MKPIVLTVVLLTVATATAQKPDVLTFDHKVSVKSTVPSLAGQTVNLYVRERVERRR